MVIGPSSACDQHAVKLERARGDYSAAVQLLQECANKGDSKAQVELASFYREGKGVDADETEAAWWYRKAAKQGEAEAQFHLGIMYLEGVGVSEDPTQALHWIAEAADKGHPEAMAVYDYILSHPSPLAC